MLEAVEGRFDDAAIDVLAQEADPRIVRFGEPTVGWLESRGVLPRCIWSGNGKWNDADAESDVMPGDHVE